MGRGLREKGKGKERGEGIKGREEKESDRGKLEWIKGEGERCV